MNKIVLAVLTAGVLLSSGAEAEEVHGCAGNVHNNARDVQSMTGVGLQCIYAASLEVACVAKKENEKNITFTLKQNILCTQLDDANNKIRGIIIYKQTDSGDTVSVVVDKAKNIDTFPAGIKMQEMT